MDTKINEELLEETLAKVERVRNWSPRVMSKLENSVRTANDEDVFRLNPIQWAQEKNVDENEAIDLFLHSAKAGLFYMDWNAICLCCGKIMRSLRNLHGLQSENTCTFCFRKDRVTLDDYVQVTFTLSPSVRLLAFHHPETLSLEDYCLKYLFERGAILAGGALTATDAMRMFLKHLSTFSPGEKITVETEVGPGLLICVDLFSEKGFGFVVEGAPYPEAQTVAIKLTETGFEVPLPELALGERRVGDMDVTIVPGEIRSGNAVTSAVFYPLRPGKVVLELEQASASKAALTVWHAPFQVPEEFKAVGAKLTYTPHTIENAPPLVKSRTAFRAYF